MRYRRRPTECEAIQWNGGETILENFEVDSWRVDSSGKKLQFWVEKSSMWATISQGDYIVAESDGNGVYPVVKDIFESSYEVIGPHET